MREHVRTATGILEQSQAEGDDHGAHAPMLRESRCLEANFDLAASRIHGAAASDVVDRGASTAVRAAAGQDRQTLRESDFAGAAEASAEGSVCEDCEVPLSAENTLVNAQERFWLNVDWTSERYCYACKQRREEDGPPDSALQYGPPDTSWYEQQLRDAGRGHLLGW